MTAAVDIMSTYEVEDSKQKANMDVLKRLEIHERAYQLCKEYLKGHWETVPRSDFQVAVLSGGLTNKLYVCRIPKYEGITEENCPHTVILRIFGLIMQDFTAKIEESVIFSILSERKVGPRLYAVFPGGRLEEYLQCRTLSTCDLSNPVLSRYISRRLASYHTMIMPVNKEPTTITNKLKLYYENLHLVQFDDKRKAALLKRFRRFDILGEINYVMRLIIDTDSPVVFCHNDVQEGNLLYSEETNENVNPIQMIDFEYSCYNYRGFDIGNHFCEWMFDYSHPKWPFYSCNVGNYPTRQQQEIFIQSYLDECFGNSHVCRGEKWQVDFMVKEANRFALLSHIFWALWSVIQEKMSDIGFGYMEYAIARMEIYFQQKAIIE